MNCDYKLRVGDVYEPCTKEATGAIRIEFWPHKAVQAMVKEPKPMQTMIIGLYVCDRCFALVKPGNVLAGEALRTLERFAMQRNQGIVPDRSQTRLVHITLDDPELQMLERSRSRNASPPAPTGASSSSNDGGPAVGAANESQPGQAAPQQGASDGDGNGRKQAG